MATVPYVYRERRALLCVVRDGTAQTEAEEYLRQTRHEAEQARLSAEAANRAKSSFVSMMSHEIRTPLNGVLGHLELLSHSTLDTAQREHLGRIRQSAELLLTIVSDVLDFSKIEAGQLAIDPVPFALRPLIEQTALLYAPLALRKGLRLYFGIDPALEPSYVADANRIRQILNNLVSNAVKFTESGRILLRASRLAGGEGEPDMLRFEVIDSGIGMSDEEVSRLFEPFTQIDASISRRFGGTGLGLALCHQLGKLLGGRISVQSTPAVGSIFALDIPAVRSTEAQPDTRHLLRGYRIALLSGMAKWRQEVSALLGGWGADVLTVGLPSELDKHWVRDAHALVIFGEQQSWSDEDEYALLACARRVIRAYMDGPLLPHRVDGAWLISCYSSEALRAAIVREDADEPMAGDAPSLPAAAAPATGDESAPSPVADDGQPARGRVLLVDDNPVNRELIQQQLEALGYATATAEDGEAALELWTNGDFDIVLTDISMPRMNGYQLARALRDRGVTLPILAVTAAALTSERSRCREAGITDLLLKPISLGQLEAAMNRHVPRQPEPAADATSPPQAWPVSPKVREIFVRSGTHDLETILDAVNRDDETMLMDRLHSLKGALLVLGEVSLAEACATLQAEVDDAGLHATRDAVAVLEQRLRDTIARYASEP
ncbi:hybrid sensor histidine kinase/response regulator [Dyella sp. EPa41]|uniref:hybrid sensor histidine kinase/response regulator n=1 Tax=Dyella sp. EPa41 TaxID=1561194 RepID=UPI001915CD92|nr:hybrid sensor histidine kinase/response regulator [Dyella sp. EPa41]